MSTIKSVNYAELPVSVISMIVEREGSTFVPDSISCLVRSTPEVNDQGAPVNTAPRIEFYYALGSYRGSIDPITLTPNLQEWFDSMGQSVGQEPIAE